jgi:hypothetical protein
MSTLPPKLSAEQLADHAISMADDLVTHIRKMNGNTHTVKEMISDIWAHRENTPFVVTVYEAIQEVKPDDVLSNIGRKSVES